MQIIAILAIILTIGELIVRAFLKDYIVGNAVFIMELFFVASFMLYFTKRFTALVTEVQQTLGINFMDEKNQLRCSLGVFLVCYFLRAMLKLLTMTFHGIYGDLWGDPTLAASIVTLVQILTDVLPLMIICQQHHTAFSNEGRGQTGMTLGG